MYKRSVYSTAVHKTSLTEVQFALFESLKSIQVQSSDQDQSLPVVVFKSGMSSTSSQDLLLSETDLYTKPVFSKTVHKTGLQYSCSQNQFTVQLCRKPLNTENILGSCKF